MYLRLQYNKNWKQNIEGQTYRALPTDVIKVHRKLTRQKNAKLGSMIQGKKFQVKQTFDRMFASHPVKC